MEVSKILAEYDAMLAAGRRREAGEFLSEAADIAAREDDAVSEASLRGELTVVADDGRERSFRAGEGVIEMVGRLHYGENRGEEPVELVMVYAGSDGLPLSEPAE